MNTITHTQIPEGTILNVLDSSGKQLYSPYDTNGNAIKTKCTVTMGEENILPLPANYLTDTNYIDFEPGVYVWQLKYLGDEYYNAYSIPFVVEIRDFKTFEIINPQIYPNENLQIQIFTPVNTIYSVTDLDSDLLTPNATYDASTGILTVPNSDITDLTIGEHTQVINQAKNYILDYEILNPITFVSSTSGGISQGIETTEFTMRQAKYLGYMTSDQNRVGSINGSVYNIQATPNLLSFDGISSSGSKYITKTYRCPPGTYHVTVTGKVANISENYTCERTITVKTDDCTIDLSVQGQELLSQENPSITLVSCYSYNNGTSWNNGISYIANATMSLINIDTNTVIDTQTTNSNGIINWTINQTGNYKVVALDYDNTWILSSDTYTAHNDTRDYVEDININNNANLIINVTQTSTPENETLVNSISMNTDGNLILNIDTGSINSAKDISIDNKGNLKYK